MSQWSKVQKHFIDGINFNVWDKFQNGTHHPSRHVVVQRVIGGPNHHLMTIESISTLERGFTHTNASIFGLLRSRDHASIVVGQHHDGSSFKLGLEDPFARRVKVVAIRQGVHRVTVGGRQRSPRPKCAHRLLPRRQWAGSPDALLPRQVHHWFGTTVST